MGNVVVSCKEHKTGGKYPNGIAHMRVPGKDDGNDTTTGSLIITVRSIDGLTMGQEPFCKVRLVAKHRHHGGYDVACHTQAQVQADHDHSLDSPFEEEKPSLGNLVFENPANEELTEDNPMAFELENSYTAEVMGSCCTAKEENPDNFVPGPGKVQWNEQFEFHVNEHTKEFSFEVVDVTTLKKETVLGRIQEDIAVLKLYREKTLVDLPLTKTGAPGEISTMFLTVEICFSTVSTVPLFHFLGEFGHDNARFKDPDSCGVESWVHIMDHSWHHRWMYLCTSERSGPCLRMYKNVESEKKLEELGVAEKLRDTIVSLAPHQIMHIRHEFDHKKTHKHRRGVSHFLHTHSAKVAAQQLKNCEFQFQTVDEVEYAKSDHLASADNFGGVVHVHLDGADGLPQMDLNGLTDAYVIAELEEPHEEGGHRQQKGAMHKSRTHQNTLAPVWNECWAFRLHHDSDHIRFTVYDHDPVGPDDVIGEIIVTVDDIKRTWENIQQPASAGSDQKEENDSPQLSPRLGKMETYTIQPVSTSSADGENLGSLRMQFEYIAPRDAESRLLTLAREVRPA